MLDNEQMTSLAPYDTLLLVSFGGPEEPEQVMPFLRNVTRGRDIPQARLAAVAEHYQHFGGRSPINDQNRALLAALSAELTGRGVDVPVVWGNRNWAPYVTDALRQAHGAGARRVLAVLTSAYSSYSGCRQYREDLAAAQATLAAEGIELQIDKVRHYYNHPGFADANAAAALEALRALPAGAHLAFVTHSLPTAMDQTSGPHGHAYTEQHRDLAATIADVASRELGHAVPWALAYCSRSGSPHQPWLEPDIGDHLRALGAAGAPGVAVVPIGFVSDHLEVVYDLDTEAKAVAGEIGLPFARAATAGTHPLFVRGLVDLAQERAATARGERPDQPYVGAQGPSHAVCPSGCCRNPTWPAYDVLADLAERAARAGGDLIRDKRPEDLGVAVTKSSPTDVVTVMDQACEDLLRDLLLGERPDDGMLGEEGGGIVGASGLTWVVDPIDGTVNYLYDIPQYAVSVAVVSGDPNDDAGHEVLAGCVHNPASGETWTATLGGGARLNGRPISCADGDDLSQALLATGFGYQASRRVHQAQVVADLLPRVRDIRRMGSGALDLCQVACGRVDAYYERGLQPWDLAAGGLIAREAGALVSGLGDAAPGHELIVAAGPRMHARLQAALRDLAPDTDGEPVNM